MFLFCRTGGYYTRVAVALAFRAREPARSYTLASTYMRGVTVLGVLGLPNEFFGRSMPPANRQGSNRENQILDSAENEGTEFERSSEASAMSGV